MQGGYSNIFCQALGVGLNATGLFGFFLTIYGFFVDRTNNVLGTVGKGSDICQSYCCDTVGSDLGRIDLLAVQSETAMGYNKNTNRTTDAGGQRLGLPICLETGLACIGIFHAGNCNFCIVRSAYAVTGTMSSPRSWVLEPPPYLSEARS